MEDGADDIEFHFFDPSQPVGHLSGNLPHWRQEGVRYFVTFRLADSIPQIKLRQWHEERESWLKHNPPPHSPEQVREFWSLFPERFHRWLDAGYGTCVLCRLAIAELLRGVLRHFDAERYELGEHVVMPNHVHAVVSPLPGFELSAILHTWKSYSANKINALAGRRGTLWQKESFDHIVRSPEQLARINAYIRGNSGEVTRHPCRVSTHWGRGGRGWQPLLRKGGVHVTVSLLPRQQS